METHIVHDVKDLDHVAKNIIPLIKQEKIILFYGEMGAGKTTFIKSICQHLGCEDEVSSPTYSLVNEYPTDSQAIYHFDLFRLESKEEALDIGIEEYMDSQAICLIEWPQIILNYISGGLKIEIEKIDLNSRKISIFKF